MRAEILLEALGNESRRRILELLTRKPCYVSEISYTLRMAPKVVLEHLDKLEKAGIVKSFENGRRRYFYVTSSLNLSIRLSPYRFKTSMPEEDLRKDFGDVNKDIDIDDVFKEIREILSIKAEDVATIYTTMQRAEEVERKLLSLQKKLAEVVDSMLDKAFAEISRIAETEIDQNVLFEIVRGESSAERISERLGVPFSVISHSLERLESRGIVEKISVEGKTIWRIRR